MHLFTRKLTLLINFVFVNTFAFSQYTINNTCIGGSGNEVIYPRYFNEESDKYNFKLNDGGSMYFFYTNSTDGDFAPNRGYNDLVIVKINNDGEIAFKKNIGNSFYEDEFTVKQSKDSSRFYILLENHSNDSVLVNGFVGDVTIQYALFCIDKNGTILWNKILYDEVCHIDNYSNSNYPNWVQLFLDRDDNCIVQYNKIKVNTGGRFYHIDSINNLKIDKNGNTIWEKTNSPYSLYNNFDSSFQIDTFYVGTTTFTNQYTETDNKYFFSAYLSKNYAANNFQSRSLIYTIDKVNASFSSILIDSSYRFNFIGLKDEFITYGSFVKFVVDSSNKYNFFQIRKYDEQLHQIYVSEKMNNTPEQFIYTGSFSTSISSSYDVHPYFNADSSQVWFSTIVNTSSLGYYMGMLYSFELISMKTYANILNAQTGNVVEIDLNKKKYNFLIDKISNEFFYYSIDTFYSSNIYAPALITVYNFNGSELRNRDSIYAIFDIYNNAITKAFCNINNTIILYKYDSTLQFIVLDALLNKVMQENIDTVTYTADYFNYVAIKYNIHILDTNRYCVLKSIWQDTISGCYPNSDNILHSLFSKNNLVSSIKNNIGIDFLNVYPNPNNGSFSIDFSSKGNYPITLILFDVTGKIIYTKTLQHHNQSLLQISDNILPSGLYNIQIRSANDVWNKKILIQGP